MNIKVCGLWSVVCGLFLTGCVDAPPPPSLNEAWVPPAEARHNTDTWKDTRARQPDLSKPLVLLDITNLALQNNPATAKAWNDARAASEQIRFTEGYFMPSVTAVVGANRLVTSAHPASFDANSMTYGPGLQLNYLVCNFGGGRRAAVEQALQTVYAANFLFNRAIQDTLLTAQLAYYGSISAQAALDAAVTNIADATATLDAAKARRDAGVGTDLEVLQAQAQYDQAVFQRTDAEGQKATARGTLAAAMNLPADTALTLVAPEAPLPTTLGGQDVKHLTDEALARRPDLAALRASLTASEASIRVAKAGRWPSLYLNGTATRDYYELYGQSNRATASDDWNYTGGVSLNWNLFNGYQTLSQTRTAEARADAARAQLRGAELAAATDIWIRFQEYETALRKYEAGQSALLTAVAAQQSALDSYKAGVKGILDLINAENLTAQTRARQAVLRQDIFASLAQLAHAMGTIEKGEIQNPESRIQ